MAGESSDFKKLIVWNKSMVLAKEVYSIVKFLPKEENFALSDQMRRAVVSISSNIAEGHGRDSYKEFIRFIKFAKGSLCELESQCHVAIEIGYIPKDSFSNIFALCAEIGRMLKGLEQYLYQKMNADVISNNLSITD